MKCQSERTVPPLPTDTRGQCLMDEGLCPTLEKGSSAFPDSCLGDRSTGVSRGITWNAAYWSCSDSPERKGQHIASGPSPRPPSSAPEPPTGAVSDRAGFWSDQSPGAKPQADAPTAPVTLGQSDLLSLQREQLLAVPDHPSPTKG